VMNIHVMDCVRKYIKKEYIGGGVIKVSDVSKYCDCSEGALIKALVELENHGEVRIEKRYACPEFHSIRDCEVPFCSECDIDYPEEFINVYFYFKPLTLSVKG
jgi:hypothetical protein